MAHQSGLIVNLTIKVDSGILLLARHRALLERTSVNRMLADALEDYADGTMAVARRSTKAVYVFGVVEEVRRLRRLNRSHQRVVEVVQSPSEAELAPYQTSNAQHERTSARRHDRTNEG
ncbi:MAG: hypothetical protein ACXWWL_00065 [Candidatus Limnocylindria bacterium]